MRSEKLCCRFLGECKFVWLCNRYMRAVMNLECNEVLQHFWLSHSCISTLLTLKSALFSPIFIFKMIFSRASSSLGSLAKASLPSKIMPFLCYLSFSSSFIVWGFFSLLGSSASLLGFVGVASILGSLFPLLMVVAEISMLDSVWCFQHGRELMESVGMLL